MKYKWILISSVLAMLVGCQTAPQMPSGWKETTGDGKFSFYMPDAPEASVQTVNSDIGPLKLHLFVLQKGDVRYFVVYNDANIDMSKASESTVKTSLDKSSQSLIKTFNGKLVSEKDISLQGNPGRDVKIATMDGKQVLRCRFYFVGKRIYFVELVAPSSKSDSKDADTFLNSFTLK